MDVLGDVILNTQQPSNNLNKAKGWQQKQERKKETINNKQDLIIKRSHVSNKMSTKQLSYLFETTKIEKT